MASRPGLRVALCTQGTRGDFQPFIALGVRLLDEGIPVKLFGDESAAKTCKEFGIDGVQISPAVKDVLTSKRGQKACISGDLMDIGAQDSEEEDEAEEEDGTDWQQIFEAAITEFKPTLVLWSALIEGLVKPWLEKTHVPDIHISLQPQTHPTNDLIPIPFQRIKRLVDKETPNIALWVMLLQTSADPFFQALDMAKAMNMPNPSEAVKTLSPVPLQTPEECFDGLFGLDQTMRLKVCAFSPAFWPAPADWPSGGVAPGRGGIEVVGRWSIPKERQDEMSKGGGAFFSSGSHEETLRFLEAGEPPVYLGWGSMVVYSKEHMTALAVGALKAVGKRGIVLGGWAGLSLESLDGAPDAEELREYCSGRVLFLKSAPHEWLFPRCQAAVHHGGIGTTQASLAAGCPTVITPVFADQHDIAEHIRRRKFGTATGLFSQATVEELSVAIRTCCDDPAIKVNVSNLAQDMAKEDGIGRTIEIIKRLMEEEVQTGKWEERRLAVAKSLQERRKKQEKLRKEAILSRWNSELAASFPVLKRHQERQLDLMSRYNTLLGKGLLWGVIATSCLARAAESIKSPEVGRFQQWAILEQIGEGKNGRLRMKRLEGPGADEGWVSPTTKDTKLLQKVASMEEVGKLRELQFQNLYKNLMPKEKKKA